MAVAGLDIDQYLQGARDVLSHVKASPHCNDIIQYATIRNCLYESNYNVEVAAAFEPRLTYFLKWWVQMFGESEGKQGRGIFPASAMYSEDLHAIGQYMQEGKRFLIETVIFAKTEEESYIIQPDTIEDGFDYLSNKDMVDINSKIKESTIEAHVKGGVPVIQIVFEKLDEQNIGALYYFFMLSCAVSGLMLGINPFDQEGVEEYKRAMFKKLEKDGKGLPR
jgi:glucose-6-phosphate isomerase